MVKNLFFEIAQFDSPQCSLDDFSLWNSIEKKMNLQFDVDCSRCLNLPGILPL